MLLLLGFTKNEEAQRCVCDMLTGMPIHGRRSESRNLSNVKHSVKQVVRARCTEISQPHGIWLKKIEKHGRESRHLFGKNVMNYN